MRELLDIRKYKIVKSLDLVIRKDSMSPILILKFIDNTGIEFLYTSSFLYDNYKTVNEHLIKEIKIKEKYFRKIKLERIIN